MVLLKASFWIPSGEAEQGVPVRLIVVGMFPSSMEWVQYDDGGSKREASGHTDIKHVRKMGVRGIYQFFKVILI